MRNNRKVKYGDKVLVSYTVSTSKGATICRSNRHSPLELRVGERQIFPRADDALRGLRPGAEIRLRLTAEEAYGKYDSNKVFRLKSSDVEKNVAKERGATLLLRDELGREYFGVVADVQADETLVVDTNHPLAGCELDIELKLLRHL